MAAATLPICAGPIERDAARSSVARLAAKLCHDHSRGLAASFGSGFAFDFGAAFLGAGFRLGFGGASSGGFPDAVAR